MYDIVFITPNMTGDISGEVLGTLLLATICKNHDLSCDILRYYTIGDVQDFEGFLDRAMEILAEKKPKIVSFYTRCDTYHIDLCLARLIKEKCPDVYVVFAGPHADLTSTQTVEEIPWVDFVCCGEGETTIVPFFASLMKSAPDLSVAGLVYRQGGKVIQNPRPELMPDLDNLPMVDYSFFTRVEGLSNAKNRGFPVDVGRGCPFGCSYCSTKTFWGRKFRVKSSQRIVEEIRDIYNRFGITHFSFKHDMLTLNRAKVLEICSLLKQLDFPVQWSCSARLDCVDPELIDIMVDAGMVSIFYGVETGSPRMQKLIHKNLKLDRAFELVEYTAKKGVKTVTSFIYGFPEETEEDLSATISLMGRMIGLGKVKIQAHLCAFLPGTEMSERYSGEMVPVEFYSDITGECAVTQCRDIIQEHPRLFQHMMEYKTEFRTKLKYYRLFMNVWQMMTPVYRYLSAKYPENRLIDMYYDFAEANRVFLETADENDPNFIFRVMIPNDRLPERFSDDPNYDLIKDIYRYMTIEWSETVQSGGAAAEMFCFNPGELKKKPIEEMERCVAMVTWDQKKRSVSCYPAM